MSERAARIPGPDHPITIEPAEGRVLVRFQGRVVADTDRALVLTEASYRPVYYLPLDAIDPDVLATSDRMTWCPYKGDASYYSLSGDEGSVADAVWTYRTPHDAVAPIAGHVAFYPQHVTIDVA